MSKRVVVVGGGYGGTEVIRQMVLRGIRNVRVELVSDRTHFENTIGGTELISEKAKLEELKYDLKDLSEYWGFDLMIGRAERIDLNEKTVKVGKKEKDYDISVLAIGSETNFYHVKGADLAHPAYHLSEFISLNKKLRQFSGVPEVVIAGGGFVGLECAAEILDLFKAIKNEVKVTVVEKMGSVLPAYNNLSARKIATEYFTSQGVKLIVGNGVNEVQKERLVLEDGSSLQTDLTVWTAGIKGCLVSSQIAGGELFRGCVEVDDRLTVKGRDDAFAVGDVAYVRINDKEASKMAAEALEQAKTVAKNIGLIAEGKKPRVSHVPNYTTDNPKALLSLGQGKAMLIFGPDYVSTGSTEYFLKKRVDFQEIMERFP